jgi:hypothetical protein
MKCQDSAVGIGLRSGRSAFDSQQRQGEFSFLDSVQTDSLQSNGYQGSFPERTAAGA